MKTLNIYKNLSFISLISFFIGTSIFIFSFFINYIFEGSAIFLILIGPSYLFLDKYFLPRLFLGPFTYIYIYHLFGYSIGPLAQKYLLNFMVFNYEGMIKAQYGAIIGLVTFFIVSVLIFTLLNKFFINKLDIKKKISEIELKHFTIILLLITLFQLIYSYKSGGIRRIGGDEIAEVSGITHSIINSFINVQYIVFFFLGYLAFIKKGKWLYITFIFYFLYSFFYILEGNRGQLVVSFILLVSGFVWGGFPKSKLYLYIIIFIIIFIPLAGIIDVYRSVTSASAYETGFISRITSIFESASSNKKEINSGTSTLIIAPFVYAVSAHTADLVFEKTPNQIPYAGFKNMLAPFYGFIPSFFKIERPDIDDGSYIAADYGNGLGKGSKSWEYTPSAAEGYRRFSWFGIILIYSINAFFFSTLFFICNFKSYNVIYLSMLIILILAAPGVWAFTFNYMFFYFMFVFTRYIILFSFIALFIKLFTKKIVNE